MSNAATIAAVAAAAEAARRAQEEESMSGYSAGDLADNWQFKIVRGNFSTREAIEALREEQAAHGWTLVEVFDAQRVRFKRPAALAAKDVAREGNPYATTSRVGRFSKEAWAVMIGLLVGLVFLLALLVFTVSSTRREVAMRPPDPVRVIELQNVVPARGAHVEH